MRTLRLFFHIIFIYFSLSSTAHAYVDGGTALLLLQGIFAVIGAVLAFFKKPWQLISKIFSRKNT
jgi:hypothetical protein